MNKIELPSMKFSRVIFWRKRNRIYTNLKNPIKNQPEIKVFLPNEQIIRNNHRKELSYLLNKSNRKLLRLLGELDLRNKI